MDISDSIYLSVLRQNRDGERKKKGVGTGALRSPFQSFFEGNKEFLKLNGKRETPALQIFLCLFTSELKVNFGQREISWRDRKRHTKGRANSTVLGTAGHNKSKHKGVNDGLSDETNAENARYSIAQDVQTVL